MTIRLYNMTYNPIVINKTLPVSYTEKTVEFKGDIDLLDISFELAYDSSLMNKNYAYISDLGRYYFIKPVGIVGQRIIFSGHCDVLKSWSSNIKSSNCIATRSNMGNLTIPDPMILELPNEQITYRKLSTEITGGTYVAIIGGK